MDELVDNGWYFQSFKKYTLLSLDSDISGPFHESGEVTLWLNIVSDTEVSGPLDEKWILGFASAFSS